MSYTQGIILEQQKQQLSQQVKSFGADKIMCHLTAVKHLVSIKKQTSLNDDDYLKILREQV